MQVRLIGPRTGCQSRRERPKGIRLNHGNFLSIWRTSSRLERFTERIFNRPSCLLMVGRGQLESVWPECDIVPGPCRDNVVGPGKKLRLTLGRHRQGRREKGQIFSTTSSQKDFQMVHIVGHEGMGIVLSLNKPSPVNQSPGVVEERKSRIVSVTVYPNVKNESVAVNTIR